MKPCCLWTCWLPSGTCALTNFWVTRQSCVLNNGQRPSLCIPAWWILDNLTTTWAKLLTSGHQAQKQGHFISLWSFGSLELLRQCIPKSECPRAAGDLVKWVLVLWNSILSYASPYLNSHFGGLILLNGYGLFAKDNSSEWISSFRWNTFKECSLIASQK